MNPSIQIYDTTLRDGTQGEGVSFTVAGKLRVAQQLDAFGIDYVEGGWPGSNPRDMAFFDEAKKVEFQHAKLVAFGSTRRASLSAEEDPQLRLLLDAETPVITIFGKTWLLHITEILRTTAEENLKMIEEKVQNANGDTADLMQRISYLKEQVMATHSFINSFASMSEGQ